MTPASIEQEERFWHAPKGTALIIGSRSDIAAEIGARFRADNWNVTEWHRDVALVPDHKWDVCVIALGVLAPIGKFFDLSEFKWEANVHSNALIPLRLLRDAWPNRRPGASVCFFSGAGVSRPAQTYSGYAASKAMLMKMTELLDDEYEDTKFFILGPGMVRTKIQQQTIDAGAAAFNHERVKKFMDAGDESHGTGTSHQKIYDCLRWCMAQPKSVVGGRNFYVPNFEWNEQTASILAQNRDIFKLRRFGGGL